MTRFAQIYCLIAILLSLDFVLGTLTELSGIHFDALMLLAGVVYIAWLPICVIGSVVFLVRRKTYLAVSAASYVVYVVVNYLATPDNLSKVKLDSATICGFIFFCLYGIGNAWLLKQLLSSEGGKTITRDPHSAS